MNDLIISNHSLDEAFELILGDTSDFPINFDKAWQWMGFSRKDVAKRALVKNFLKDVDYSTLRKKVERQWVEDITLTTDCFKSFCMLAQTEQGKLVRQYYLVLEKRFLAGKKLWEERLNSREALLEYLKNQDKQIHELNAKVTMINDDYVSLAGYYALQGQRWNLTRQMSQSLGRDLARKSRELGYFINKVPHEKYGQANAYHKDVLKVVLGF